MMTLVGERYMDARFAYLAKEAEKYRLRKSHLRRNIKGYLNSVEDVFTQKTDRHCFKMLLL